jgi:hypothetical protein
MAAALATRLGPLERIESALLLGVGDAFGPDSMRHLAGVLHAPFTVLDGGRERHVLPFGHGAMVDFGPPTGLRTAYLFPWSDVIGYPRSLGVRTSLGRFALDPAWLGGAAMLAAHAGVGRWLGGAGAGPLRRLEARYRDRDRFALVVTASGHGQVATMRLGGRGQADVTAAAAAITVRALALGQVTTAGLHLPESVLDPGRFFAALAREGYVPSLDLGHGAASPVPMDRSGFVEEHV